MLKAWLEDSPPALGRFEAYAGSLVRAGSGSLRSGATIVADVVAGVGVAAQRGACASLSYLRNSRSTEQWNSRVGAAVGASQSCIADVCGIGPAGGCFMWPLVSCHHRCEVVMSCSRSAAQSVK